MTGTDATTSPKRTSGCGRSAVTGGKSPEPFRPGPGLRAAGGFVAFFGVMRHQKSTTNSRLPTSCGRAGSTASSAQALPRSSFGRTTSPVPAGPPGSHSGGQPPGIPRVVRARAVHRDLPAYREAFLAVYAAQTRQKPDPRVIRPALLARYADERLRVADPLPDGHRTPQGQHPGREAQRIASREAHGRLVGERIHRNRRPRENRTRNNTKAPWP